MLRFYRTMACLALLAISFNSALGFTLGGSFEAYQTTSLGYNFAGDQGGPKNIGDEFRYNVPELFYAFDEAFMDYFGSNGVQQVEEALGMLNALTNTPFSSLDLNVYPLESMRINPRAQALNLVDLKTVALNSVLGQMGLVEPDRYVWTLRDRIPAPSCPSMIYYVIRRNFDPYTYEPSAYINGQLYTYVIIEDCGTPSPPPDAVTVNAPIDPNSPEYTSLLSGRWLSTVSYTDGMFRYGSYVTGIDKDSIGGLKYLYRTNLARWESASADSTLFATNPPWAQELLFTSNLTLFAWQAMTNNAAALAALYPNLVFTGPSSNYFTNVWVTNISLVAVTTNLAGGLVFQFTTNRSLTFQQRYVHHFANFVLIKKTPTGWVTEPAETVPPPTNRVIQTWQTIATTPSPWAPWTQVPVLTTNNVNFSTNEVAGEYIILNTNACDMKLLAVQGVFTNTVTNLVVNATNNPSLTNITVPGTTNTAFFEQSLLSYQTQHVFLALQVNCATTNTLAVRQGMDSFRYTRTSFDSLIGRYYQPITNYYRLVENTNSTYVTNFLRRVVTFPDIWFDAVDLDDAIFARAVPNFSTNALDALSSGVGPGIINPGWIITFNKVGPLVVLSYAPFLVENGLSERTAGLTGGTNFVWGSYNGTDAEPIVYPSQSSIASLQNMFSFQIVTTDLPVGRVGAAYSAQLQAEGGQEPVVWSLAPGSAPFAAGLQLSGSGLVSGTPAAAGQFTVMVVARDSANRVTERPLTLTIQVQ